MHICFMTNKYPNEVDGNTLVFLKQLVDEIAEQDVKCSVVCPVPTSINRNYKKLPLRRVEGKVTIYYPRYFGLGQRNYLCFNPAKITTHFFTKAVEKTIKNDIGLKNVDTFYAHFVTPADIAAARLGRKFDKPAFMAYGEATLQTIQHFGEKAVKKELSSLAGVIAVSSQNKEMISEYVDSNIIEVFPNAINTELFRPIDKKIARKKLGFNEKDFIVSFVGSFDERKGINRLEKAIDSFGGDVKLAAAGKGKLKPTSENCIWDKPVGHDNLPVFYSASDLFVLPTRNEGCCNAIIEAMGCGLPIISSDRSFNYDVLNNKNSILINPDDVKELTDAIALLRNDGKKRDRLSVNAIEAAKQLSLSRRASNIMSFIKKRAKEMLRTDEKPMRKASK